VGGVRGSPRCRGTGRELGGNRPRKVHTPFGTGRYFSCRVPFCVNLRRKRTPVVFRPVCFSEGFTSCRNAEARHLRPPPTPQMCGPGAGAMRQAAAEFGRDPRSIKGVHMRQLLCRGTKPTTGRRQAADTAFVSTPGGFDSFAAGPGWTWPSLVTDDPLRYRDRRKNGPRLPRFTTDERTLTDGTTGPTEEIGRGGRRARCWSVRPREVARQLESWARRKPM